MCQVVHRHEMAIPTLLLLVTVDIMRKNAVDNQHDKQPDKK